MKPKFLEPETLMAFSYCTSASGLGYYTVMCRPKRTRDGGKSYRPVRIIREREYKRLLRAAKGKNGRG